MEHAKRLSSLARRAPMPVIGIDAEGRLSYVNDSLCALTGYDREQLIGEFFWNLVAADQSDQLRESFRRERENGVSNRLDTRVPTASGGELLIVWHNVTFMDADGHCTAVYSIGADVTALRRAERRLSRLNTSLQGLSAVSGLALRTDDPHDLLARACEARVNTGACTSAWIAPVGDDGHPIGLVGSSMHNGSSPDELRAALRDLPSCIVRAIEEPQQSVISEASDACADCLFAPQEAGVHGIVTAIGCFGEVSAVLITHVPNTEPVGEATRRVMASIADDLGFALAMLEARAMHERAERSLAERTRLLDAFFESSLDPAAILDPDFNFQRVNDAYAESCDKTPAELVGRNHFDLFPHDENKAIFEQVRDTGETYRVTAKPFEYPDHPEWGVTWWDWALVPTLDDEGNVAFISLWLRNVTEQERAKQELEAQRDRLDDLVHERTEELQSANELLRAVLDGSPVAITVHDVNGNITMWNEAAEQVTGWKAEEVLGGPSPIVAPEQQEESNGLFESILDGNAVSEVPIRWVHRDGHTVDLRLSAAPLRDSEGHVTGVVGIFSDVTQRVQAERERDRLIEQLEEERATLTALIEHAPVGIVLTDDEARIRLANPAAEHLYQRPVPIGEDRSSHKQMKLCRSGGAPYEVDELPLTRSVLRGEVVRNEELSIIWPDGQQRDLLASTAPIMTHEGGIAGAVAVFQDVTEGKANERERERLMSLLKQHADHLEEMVADRTDELLRSRDQVRRQRDFVAAVVENAGSIVVVVDAEGKIVRFNRAAEEVSGFSAEEVLQRDVIETLVPESAQEEVRQDFMTDRSDQYWQYESWWRRRDGNLRRISWRVSVIRDQRGTMEYMIGSGWDVTDERRMARELQESEEKYRELVENARTIIIRWDLDGTVRFMNEYGLELFGYTEEEMIGSNVRIIVPDVDSAGADLRGLVEAVVESPHEYWLNENENVAKDGTRYWISWSNRIMRDEDGEPVGIMAIGVDRTAQKRAEEQLRASQRNLRDLTAELAMTEQRERREIATLLHDSVGQLLAFAKLKLGSMVGKSTELDDDLGTVLHYINQAIGETRSLTTQLSPPVLEQLGFVAALQWLADEFSEQHDVPITFFADSKSVEMTEEVGVTLFQAARELVINSIKHSKAQQVNVRLLLKDESVCVEVTDDGIGFDPNIIRKRKERGGGGFGLFNVQERLTYLGGDVAIEAEPGEGSTITLICPVRTRETSTP